MLCCPQMLAYQNTRGGTAGCQMDRQCRPHRWQLCALQVCQRNGCPAPAVSSVTTSHNTRLAATTAGAPLCSTQHASLACKCSFCGCYLSREPPCPVPRSLLWQRHVCIACSRTANKDLTEHEKYLFLPWLFCPLPHGCFAQRYPADTHPGLFVTTSGNV